jgi:hypothetical protein
MFFKNYLAAVLDESKTETGPDVLAEPEEEPLDVDLILVKKYSSLKYFIGGPTNFEEIKGE